MKITRTFIETLKAYVSKYRYIVNVGGTRSGKTFSTLQVLMTICEKSKKPLVISVVSHSLPHLVGGAIRDFDTILQGKGYNLYEIKTKNPHIYNINGSIVEFIGFDKPGKALGAARDILFINEANKMSYDICHQLMQRTRKTIFIDYNPANEFWVDEYILTRDDCKRIHSTFNDNIDNLTNGQINDLIEARKKYEIEEKKGVKGYWYNWWRVYGQGLKGSLEGVIFNNWSTIKEIPDGDFYRVFGVDFGHSDPTTIIEVQFDKGAKKIYIKEHLYKPAMLIEKLIDKIKSVNPYNDEVICDSVRADLIYQFQMYNINALSSRKGAGSILEGIDVMQGFEIYITEDSLNVIDEFTKYSWVKKDDKFIDKPEDANNHAIDAIRYASNYYYKMFMEIYA